MITYVDEPCSVKDHPNTLSLSLPVMTTAPVLPGAYYPSGHTQGHSYMHQTSMHSLRSVKHRAHPTMVRRLKFGRYELKSYFQFLTLRHY